MTGPEPGAVDEAGPDPDLEPTDDIDALLEFLRDRRGFDFTGYKRPSLTRRIQRRLRATGMRTYADYVQVLESQPGEFGQLFDSILINVTSFCRDPDAWASVRQDVLPALVRRADEAGRDIRVWSAGCANGKEAFTLAVLLCEAVGEERFRTQVKLYATDADEEALREARLARYPYGEVVEAFGEEATARYFEAGDNGHAFRNDLRRSVIFGRHDLVQDPPISRIDLLVCRNTLMYFTSETQQRVLTGFHFALVEGGVLFLGKAEAFGGRTNLFTTADLTHHLFVKRPGPSPRPPIPAPPGRSRVPAGGQNSALVAAAFEDGPTAQLAVDREGVLVAANRCARQLFGFGTGHVGRLLRDMEVSYRPVEVRSVIDRVLASRRAQTVPGVEHRWSDGGSNTFDVVVQPVDESGSIIGVTVAFVDVSRYRVLQEELEQSHRELEVAHEELQSAVEELETTNEELQSTNEELETTNEELHSTNEELETMNEELQSTNEELAAVNTELRNRTDETRSANAFMESILRGLQAGVAVLDRGLGVRTWNAHAEELWGLRSDEVEGQHFLNLDIGLPVGQLRDPIRSVMGDGGVPARVDLRAVNRRGKTIDVGVTITSLGGTSDEAGVILLMEEVGHGGDAAS